MKRSDWIRGEAKGDFGSSGIKITEPYSLFDGKGDILGHYSVSDGTYRIKTFGPDDKIYMFTYGRSKASVILEGLRGD